MNGGVEGEDEVISRRGEFRNMGYCLEERRNTLYASYHINKGL